MFGAAGFVEANLRNRISSWFVIVLFADLFALGA